MPHKRAKRSVREREKAAKGADLPPTQSSADDIVPKSVARILNAGKIRQEYREKKRKHDGDDKNVGSQQKKRRTGDADTLTEELPLKIQPGETIAHFNKRVESGMMPVVKSAMQRSSAQSRKAKKSELQAKEVASHTTNKSKKDKNRDPSPSQPSSTNAATGSSLERPKEFRVASTASPRRLNDIAQAPPEFTRLPRGADQKSSKVKDKTTGVLSMAQKAMMEEEREKAIRRYRELKARRMRNDGGAPDGAGVE